MPGFLVNPKISWSTMDDADFTQQMYLIGIDPLHIWVESAVAPSIPLAPDCIEIIH